MTKLASDFKHVGINYPKSIDNMKNVFSNLPPAHINRVFGILRVYKSKLQRICQFIQGLMIYIS